MNSAAHDVPPVAQIPVGEILARALDARSWTQADFANILDRPTQFVSEIVTGKKEITRESAAQIGAALGTSPQLWLSLQDQYLLALHRENPQTQERLDAVRIRGQLNRMGPIELLRKRGILKGQTLDELETEVLEFFDIESIEDEPPFSAAAKRSNHGEVITPIQIAWVACVRQAARTKKTPKYSAEKSAALAQTLARRLHSPADFADLPDLLATAGVRLVYVEALPGSKIDGCALYVDGVPVIGLSGRGKRLDKVFFALLHELAHIALGHVDTDRVIVEVLDAKHADEARDESAANKQAAEWMFPQGFPRIPSRVSAAWVRETATDNGIAPIVLVGQLQHKNRLDWRTSFARNAPTVSEVLTRWR